MARKKTKRESTKKTKKKAIRKKVTRTEYNEAARVLALALRDAGAKRAAMAHPMVGPIIKKLGPTHFNQLSAIAKNQIKAGKCPT